jgi:hypothetical protein
MTEVTNTPNADTTDKPKRAPRVTGKIEHSAAIAAYARAHPKDPSAKGMRRVLRANRDADVAYKRHVKNAPWPAHNKSVLAKLFASDAAFVRELSRKRS